MKKTWLYPHNAERAYQKLLQDYIKQFSSATIKQLKDRELLRMDSHADGWSEDLTALFLELMAYANTIGSSVIFRLPEVYAMVNQFNDRQWRLVVKAGTGIDIAPGQATPHGFGPHARVSDPNVIRSRFGVDVDVYRSEPWLDKLQENWIAQNTQLIKSIPSQYMQQVETLVRQGVMQGTSSKALASEIAAKTGVADRRAKIIARDQIGKANAELTQYRQEDLGVTGYKWITSHDERVRGNPYGRYPKAHPSHYARDNGEFNWKKPPEGGHPGQAILCRCWADPIFPTS